MIGADLDTLARELVMTVVTCVREGREPFPAVREALGAAVPERFALDLERAAGHLERLGAVPAGQKVVVTVRAPEGSRQLAARLRRYARRTLPAAPASPPEAGR